ncbi:MAG: DUF4493 domain-containing protein [Muribaculaceae bacterium]|nr:DUF4493 domain-containing protein [Muribaculaceae bacterium]
MKKSILTGMACLALMLPMATGCSEESALMGGDTGRVELGVDFKSEPLTGRGGEQQGRAAADHTVTVDDLSLRLVGLDAEYTNTWSPISAFDNTHEFTTGRYKVEAFYGTAEDEGYDKPYYYGSDEITVMTGRTTPVTLNVTLANSIIKVVYTTAFREYMSAYSAKLHSAGGAYIDYEEENPAELYVRPGEVSLDLTITKPNGTSGTIEAARFTAKPRYRHTVTVDYNGGETGKVDALKITFDETLDSKDVDIDISDDILSASAPTVTPDGFTEGQEITMVESVAPANGVKMNVVARGKIGAVTLTTASESLLAAGWPAEVDLASPAIDVKAKLQQLGLTTLGIWTRPDEMGVIDFTDALTNIAYIEGGNNVSTFTVVVKDKQGKVSDPLSFSVNLEQLRLALSQGAILAAGEAQVRLEYNGKDVNEVTFDADNTRGTKTPLIVKQIVKEQQEGFYTVSLTHPADEPVITPEDNLSLHAYAGNCSADLLVKAPVMNIPAGSIDAYAKHATIVVNFTDQAAAAQSANAELFISTDGLSYATVKNATIQNAPGSRAVNYKTVKYDLPGLQPSTQYWILSRLGEEESLPTTFTTEAATQLPNAAMENWYSEDAYGSKTAWVGKTDIKHWFANASGESFWATRNALTTAQNSGTTCYYTSFSGTVPVSGASGQAAEISTLGYGEGSTYSSASGNGTNKHTAVGMLFIGNHTASSETSETIEYGKPFTSRPSGFSFKYKFAPINTESFKAYIVVENRDNGVVELGRGELLSGDAKSDFTQAMVNVNYTNKTLKATHMYVVFLSSTSDSPAVKGVKGSDSMLAGFADSKRIGSVLTVDDIELIY